ncbi:MAG: EAL domain-containing protein [Sulfurimonas sp.]|jgi:PAS domain S-box-containing protein/diguanylate cyclase (GGDEF)-like protein
MCEEANNLSEQYKRAVDLSSIVSKTDPEGLITYANKNFCDISGYSQEELIGKSHNIITHPDTPVKTFAELWKTITSKKIWKGIVKNRAKDGSTYTVSSIIMPIIDKDGTIVEYISIRQDITELLKQKEIINRHTTDTLTKLPNREKLLESLVNSEYPNLALLNLNNFRDINELYGYKIGDKVLIQTAKNIKEYIHHSSCELYKLPSDEFAIFVDTAQDTHYFQEMIHMIINYLKTLELRIDGYTINVNITTGIAHSKNNILIHADIALQEARKLKKCSVVYDDENNKTKEKVNNNLNWHNTIKKAIQENRIVPYFQPIYCMNTNAIKKYEALVRIIAEDGEVISPYFFLDIAKKYFQYEHITRIMIESTFEYFKDKPYDFSINLSIEDILNQDMVEFIINSIQRFNEPNRIIFEITESEGIENYADVELFVNQVRAFGCKIAIDDFGTGYSNFEHILRLKIDYLKIDGSLIKSIDTNMNSRLVVETILLFAKKLGIATITEFVCSQEIFEITKELGADYMQGYYIGKPESVISNNNTIINENPIYYI